MPDKTQWRYKNLRKDWAEQVDEYIPLLQREFDSVMGDSWEECFPGYVIGKNGMLANSYAYGLPMEYVDLGMRWLIEIYLRKYDRLLENPNEETKRQIHDINQYNALSTCILINSKEYFERLRSKLAAVLSQDYEDQVCFNRKSQLLLMRLYNNQYDEKTKDVACEVLCVNRYLINYCSLATGDMNIFNQSIEDHVKFCFDLPGKRAKKRSCTGFDLVDLDTTATVALALNSGVSFTYKDPALPIQDFPIYHKPGIRELIKYE